MVDYDSVVRGLLMLLGVINFTWQLYRVWVDIVRSRDEDDDVGLPITAPPPTQAVQLVEKRLRSDDEVVIDTFIQEKAKEEGGGCAICLVEYKDGETLATIAVCGHKYHDACVNAWLEVHDTCPLCRTQV